MGSADLNATFYGPVKKVKYQDYENIVDFLTFNLKDTCIIISESCKIKAYLLIIYE